MSLLHDEALATRHYRCLVEVTEADDASSAVITKAEELLVVDADHWWRHIETIGLLEKYPTASAQPPAMQPWGMRVLYLTDPNGVLWHIADRRERML